MKFCENNCGAFGQPGKRLMECTGCHLAYYCGTECQKARWKAHKPFCRSNQRTRAAASPDVAKLHADLQTWCRRNLRFLNLAGNSALLQHKDYLTHHVLDTHVLVVNVEPKSFSGEFDIQFAAVRPHEELKEAYHNRGGSAGDAAYATMIESSKRTAECTDTLGKIGGTMFIVVWCTGAMQVDPLAISQEIIDNRKTREHHEGWFETLVGSVINRKEGLYEAGGAYIAVNRTANQSKA